MGARITDGLLGGSWRATSGLGAERPLLWAQNVEGDVRALVVSTGRPAIMRPPIETIFMAASQPVSQ